MRINLFWKTFLSLMLAFALLFGAGFWVLQENFSARYIARNIEAVKTAILEFVLTDETFAASPLIEGVSSETQFLHYRNNQVVDRYGTTALADSDILSFVIALYDNKDRIVEGELIYVVTIVEDVTNVSYLYRYGSSDYLLVMTRIQSLRNIDAVLGEIAIPFAMVLLILIVLVSFFVSKQVSSPIRKLAAYAKKIAKLQFNETLVLNRRDEFRDLIGSLNEMAFYLRKSFDELENANLRLQGDIEFERRQEAKKRQLIQMINHELRTPISIMKGMVEGMLDGVGRYKDKETYLKEVLRQIDEIDKRTKDLTYTMRLEDLAKRGDRSELATLKDALEPTLEFARQKKVKVAVSVGEGSAAINAELLAILAANLLKNAVLYTQDQNATLEAFVDGERVILVVRNKGVLSEEDLKHVFLPYYRADRSIEGSGLGLFIVGRICEIVGGERLMYNDNGFVIAKIVLPRASDITLT
jgi:two-component system sensor histidine kinase VanS